MSTDKVKYYIHTDNIISISKLYVGSKGIPQSVKSCYNYEYDSGIVTIYVSHQWGQYTRLVEVSWVDDVQYTSRFTGDMIYNQYFMQNNIIGGILAYMISIMGVYVTFGGITLAIFIPLYVRYQSITPPSIILFLLFGLIKTIIPTPLLGFSTLIMAISAGNLIYKIVIKRRDT